MSNNLLKRAQDAAKKRMEEIKANSLNEDDAFYQIQNDPLINSLNQELNNNAPQERPEVALVREKTPALSNALTPLMQEAEKDVGKEKAAEEFVKVEADVKKLVPALSSLPPEQQVQQVHNVYNSKAAEIQGKQARGEDITTGDKLALALASALPALVAGMFGGDERTALQGGAQAVQTYTQLVNDERAVKQKQAESERDFGLRETQLNQQQAQFEADQALEREKMRSAERIAQNKADLTASQSTKLTATQEKRLNDLIDRNRSTAENLSLLKGQKDKFFKIIDDSNALSRTAAGTFPGTAAFFGNDMVEVRDAVETIIQQNLKNTLGGQFAQKEAAELFARAFRPNADKQDLKNRYNRLISKLEASQKIQELEVDLRDQGLPTTEVAKKINKEIDNIWNIEEQEDPLDAELRKRGLQ